MRYLRRTRKRNIGNELFYKRYYNQKLEYKARHGMLRGKLLDSGFYEDQTWGTLGKAWLGYIISFKHDDWERRKYYAAVIQKLEGEMGIKKYDFPEMRGMVAEFKSDTDFWRSIRGEG